MKKTDKQEVESSDYIQALYNRTKEIFLKGDLPHIESVLGLYETAPSQAVLQYSKDKSADNAQNMYLNSVEEMNKYIVKGIINPNNGYAMFAFCFLKTLELEKRITKSMFDIQFKQENKTKV